MRRRNTRVSREERRALSAEQARSRDAALAEGDAAGRANTNESRSPDGDGPQVSSVNRPDVVRSAPLREAGSEPADSHPLEARSEIARLLLGRCNNCYHKLSADWHWLTPNVGPYCADCWLEIAAVERAALPPAPAPKVFTLLARVFAQADGEEPVSMPYGTRFVVAEASALARPRQAEHEEKNDEETDHTRVDGSS